MNSSSLLRDENAGQSTGDIAVSVVVSGLNIPYSRDSVTGETGGVLYFSRFDGRRGDGLALYIAAYGID